MASGETRFDDSWPHKVVVSRSDARTRAAAYATLDGRRVGFARLAPFLGPAFIASVAYMDPGNFATNIQGGSQFGYRLLWVVVAASAMAAVLQSFSAKLGIATNKNLPAVCHDELPRWLNLVLWIVSEGAAIATDLAEFTGAALGLNLLIHVPLLWAGVITGIATFAMLGLQRFGFRPLELVIGALVAVIAGSYLIELVIARPDAGQVAFHAITPSLPSGSIFLAVAILGATIMPHVLYLHSALTEGRIPARNRPEKRRLYRMERLDIVLAMALATLINCAMMIMAAAVFYAHGLTGIADISTAYKTLTPLLGGAASLVFGVSLLASGLSSSAVGTMAGQVIMQGFMGWSIRLWVRRVVTMTPALVIIALGVNPTMVILISQAVLSFALVAPISALLYFTAQRGVMGRDLVNSRAMTVLGVAIGAIILTLNVVLLTQVL